MKWFALVALFIALPGFATDPREEFSAPAKQELYESITAETRCLVCQNNTLADSTAPLAVDLRREIRKQVDEGKDETQIKDFLVERYGDFVLYKPRFRSWNLILWLGPVVLLLVGAIAVRTIVRKRGQLPIDIDDDDINVQGTES